MAILFVDVYFEAVLTQHNPNMNMLDKNIDIVSREIYSNLRLQNIIGGTLR